MTEPTLFQHSAEPLAARMRPRSLDDFLGQEHILGPGKALGDLIRRGDVGSCIFWGPPGSGKTTLARLIANYTKRHFEPFSAATEGVGRVREIIAQAEQRLQYEGRGTILFCDEIPVVPVQGVCSGAAHGRAYPHGARSSPGNGNERAKGEGRCTLRARGDCSARVPRPG